MPKIASNIIVLRASKLVKNNEPEELELTEEQINALLEAANEILDDGIIVEHEDLNNDN